MPGADADADAAVSPPTSEPGLFQQIYREQWFQRRRAAIRRHRPDVFPLLLRSAGEDPSLDLLVDPPMDSARALTLENLLTYGERDAVIAEILRSPVPVHDPLQDCVRSFIQHYYSNYVTPGDPLGVTRPGASLTRSMSAPAVLTLTTPPFGCHAPAPPSPPTPPKDKEPPGSPHALDIQAPPDPNAAARKSEDFSKLDITMMTCTFAMLVPVCVDLKGLVSSWETPWTVVYGVLIGVAIVSTILGFLAAWSRHHPRSRKVSSFCAKLGFILAAALLIVFLGCELGHFGCAAGGASAAAVAAVSIAIWVWSARTTRRVQPVVQEVASLPNDVP
ncbi:hypothetical protein ACP4OV_011654 [Aristida adscensionis]